MSIAVVIVHKTLGGHKWSNTHGIRIGTGSTPGLSNADLVTAGASTTLDATTTGASPVNIIQAIVAFERLIHNPDVLFTDVLITDGQPNVPGGTTNQYASMTMSNLPGLAGTAGGTALEPGGIAWLIHRNVVGFGHKPGRMFVRGALVETSVSVGGPRMIQFEGTSAASWTTQLATAQAKLTAYLYGGGSNATAGYGLPIYMTPKGHITQPTVKVGTLVNMLDVSGFSSVAPVLRQVQRGKKRKTP